MNLSLQKGECAAAKTPFLEAPAAGTLPSLAFSPRKGRGRPGDPQQIEIALPEHKGRRFAFKSGEKPLETRAGKDFVSFLTAAASLESCPLF